MYLKEERLESNCWECKYHQVGGKDTFLGFCTWFVKRGEKMKEIPSHVVDKGCQYFVQKSEDAKRSDKIEKEIITLFDGEVLHEEPVRKRKKYRKTYKSKHKYGERKDW